MDILKTFILPSKENSDYETDLNPLTGIAQITLPGVNKDFITKVGKVLSIILIRIFRNHNRIDKNKK